MENYILSVREITADDIEPITNYWFNADVEFLRGMGADIEKLPTSEQWINMLSQQIQQGYTEKQSYCIVWQVNGKSIGHSNVNKIVFGEEAHMHLHIWDPEFRNKGLGLQFLQMAIPYFFKNLDLKNLYSEPYALNPSPNKTLPKLGFEFQKEYITIPGFINFEQPVNQWLLSHKRFSELF